MKYAFSFLNGHPIYGGKLCIVEVPDSESAYSDARTKFVEKFGLDFCSQYPESEYVNFPKEIWWKMDRRSEFINFDETPYMPPKQLPYNEDLIAELYDEENASFDEIYFRNKFFKLARESGWTENDIKAFNEFIVAKEIPYKKLMLRYLE